MVFKRCITCNIGFTDNHGCKNCKKCRAINAEEKKRSDKVIQQKIRNSEQCIDCQRVYSEYWLCIHEDKKIPYEPEEEEEYKASVSIKKKKKKTKKTPKRPKEFIDPDNPMRIDFTFSGY